MSPSEPVVSPRVTFSTQQSILGVEATTICGLQIVRCQYFDRYIVPSMANTASQPNTAKRHQEQNKHRDSIH